MSRLFRPGLLLLSAVALAAAAEETPSTEVAVGVAGGYSKGLYRSYDGNWSALPLVQVESPYFYVRRLSAGARVFSSDDQTHEVLVGSTWQLGQAFKPSRADDRQLQQLDRRRDIVTADLAYNFYSPYGNVETQWSADISGRSKGQLASIQYSYFWQPDEALTVTPAIGVKYADKRYNRYYYGITAKEAARSGLPAYAPGATLQPYLDVAAEHRFSRHFSAFASARLETLGADVKRSPMVDESFHFQGAAGLLYRF